MTTKTQLKLSEIALMLGPCLFYADYDFMGIPAFPFDEQTPKTQQAYYRRAELTVLGGIGYLHARAQERAVRCVSVRHQLFEELNEDGARLAEIAMGDVMDEYETQLMQAYQESQR